MSSSLHALLKLSKTTSPQKLFPSDYITLYTMTSPIYILWECYILDLLKSFGYIIYICFQLYPSKMISSFLWGNMIIDERENKCNKAKNWEIFTTYEWYIFLKAGRGLKYFFGKYTYWIYPCNHLKLSSTSSNKMFIFKTDWKYIHISIYTYILFHGHWNAVCHIN